MIRFPFSMEDFGKAVKYGISPSYPSCYYGIIRSSNTVQWLRATNVLNFVSYVERIDFEFEKRKRTISRWELIE
jgi:hypothetical protein